MAVDWTGVDRLDWTGVDRLDWTDWTGWTLAGSFFVTARHGRSPRKKLCRISASATSST